MKINRMNKKLHKRSGFILPATMALIIVLGMVAGSMFFMNRTILHSTERWQESDEALLAAQCAMEEVKNGVHTAFKSFYQTLGQQPSAFKWFDSAGTNAQCIGGSAMGISSYYDVSAPITPSNYPACTVTCRFVGVESGLGVVSPERILRIRCQATTPSGLSRSVEERVRFGIERAEIFNYAYFLNNYGWFYGVSTVISGDIRSNYDMDFNASKFRLNGTPYASGIMSGGYSSLSCSDYYSSWVSDHFRPTTPPDMGGGGVAEWPMGYDPGNVTAQKGVAQLEMPYLGDLSSYTNFAAVTHGRVMQGTNVLIDQYFSSTNVGPSGIAGAADSGCIALIGTAADPLVITGAVVVVGDVVIGGYYTGQGTIYAGRNVHIVDSLTSMDGPSWPKPDPNPFETALTNATKDLLGLAAKGNVIMSDYTQSGWISGIGKYMKPSFTDAYPVDATDSNIGYCSYSDGVNWYFDGDYTDYDGGYKADGTKRRYYESSLSKADFRSFVPSGSSYGYVITRMDAVIYNNHLTGGYWGYNAVVNGGLVCRDEAIMPHGYNYFNWDIRLGDHSYDSVDTFFYLPTVLAPFETITWSEVANL